MSVVYTKQASCVLKSGEQDFVGRCVSAALHYDASDVLSHSPTLALYQKIASPTI